MMPEIKQVSPHMLKEIHEQPSVVRNTLSGRLHEKGISANIFGQGADALQLK